MRRRSGRQERRARTWRVVDACLSCVGFETKPKNKNIDDVEFILSHLNNGGNIVISRKKP